MKISYGKDNLLSIIFCIILFLISLFIFNMTSQEAIEQNIKRQLDSVNKHVNELAKFKIENILEYKLQIFTNHLIESNCINNNDIDNEELVKLMKYFKNENFIQNLGVILDDEGILLNENDEKKYLDKNTIYNILLTEKNIFKHMIDKQDYLIIKNEKTYGDGQRIVTITSYKNNFQNDELTIPVYTEKGYAFVIDKSGNSILKATVHESTIHLSNILDKILSFSEDNLDSINKLRLDMFNNKSGIIIYKDTADSKIAMSYSPIGVDDLYICTIIPEDIMSDKIREFEILNKISIVIIIIDLFALFIFFKIIDKKKSKEREKLLNLDTLTNGNSYKKFQEQLKEIYNRKDIKAIYMAIDLDNFKIVNTVLGKECGDEVLKKVYEILEFHIRDKGCYCRKIADEFLAYYEYKDSEDIEYIVSSICKSIRHIRLPKSHILIPSVGICYMSDKDINIESLEVNAIIAKKKSKNKINEFYSFFKDDNLDEMIDSKNILDEMNKAIINKEFRLLYQPKFDAKSKKIVGAEALIRWTKPDNSVAFPNQFIPIAEKTGFITFIDSYVFKQVCEKQAEWIKNGYNIVPISVNISREKIKDQNFLYEYLKIITDTDLEKEYVQLEITEGDTYSYDNVKTNIVDLIKDVGFKVIIDDFGVGYSSLTMLKDIKADVLKLDRSFIIDETSNGKSMLKYIIKIAKIFNYRIVAEGVETEEQYNFLKEDCDEIQGYYFSKPLEEDVFIEKYLKHGKKSLI